MGNLSKMATKCQVCPDRDKCDHKYMEACAYIERPKITASNTIPNDTNIPVMNIGSVISANMGDIAKKLEKELRRKMSRGCER